MRSISFIMDFFLQGWWKKSRKPNQINEILAGITQDVFWQSKNYMTVVFFRAKGLLQKVKSRFHFMASIIYRKLLLGIVILKTLKFIDRAVVNKEDRDAAKILVSRCVCVCTAVCLSTSISRGLLHRRSGNALWRSESFSQSPEPLSSSRSNHSVHSASANQTLRVKPTPRHS